MAESLALVWDLIARDSASPTFARVGASAEGASAGVGKLLGGLSALAVGGAIAASVKAAADFQAQMLLVQTQAGATAQEVADMSPKILALAGQVAQAPEALATSLYHVESTGLRGSAALDAVRIAAEGAKVGHADLEETTNALTATIASGMLPATETYAQAMGQLNTIVGSGDMKMQDLNAALSTGLLVTVKQYGVNLNDVGAALADFGDNNIRGEDAATRLRMAVQAIASPGKNAAGILGEIGVNVDTLKGKMEHEGLNSALVYLHDHLVSSGKSATEWGDLLTNAFTKKAGGGIVTLMGTFDRFEQKYQEVSKGADSFGDAWANTTKTANFQFGQLKDSVEAIGISLGEKLLPPISVFMGWLNSTAIPAVEHFGSSLTAAVQSPQFQSFLSDVVTIGGEAWGAIQKLAGVLGDLGGTILPPIIAAGGQLVSFFAGLPGPIQLAVGAFVALRIAAGKGMFDGLLATVGGVGGAFRNFGADVSATAGVLEHAGVPLPGFVAALQTTADRGLGVFRGAAKGVVDMLGGPFMTSIALAGGAVAGWSATLQATDAVAQDVTQHLKDGSSSLGQQYQDLATNQSRSIADAHSWGDAMDIAGAAFQDGAAQLKGFNSAADEAKTKGTQAYEAWYGSLDRVGKAQADLTKAQKEYDDAVSQYGANSSQAIDAAGKLQSANKFLKTTQDDVNQATKDHLSLLTQQSNLELAAVNSHAGLQIAQLNLTSAIDDYNAKVKDGTLKGNDLKKAQADLEQQMIRTATQTAQDAADTAKANGVTDTSITYNNTLHDTLQKLADKFDGPVHDALQQAADATKKAAIQTDSFRDATDKLGLMVGQAWPDGTKVVQQATAQQIDALKQLGYHVTTLPGSDPNKPQTIFVTANTSQAYQQLTDFEKRAQDLGFVGAMWNVGAPIGNGNAGSQNPVGLPPIPGVPHKATGGLMVGPGSGTSDSIHAMLSNGEFVVNAKATSQHMELLHAINSGGIGRYAQGGLVWPAGLSSQVMGNLNAGLAAKQAAAAAVASSAGGAARWAPLVDQVLRMLGISLTAEAGVLSMISAESGGNPNAINLTDSNARAGHPSQGLMQTIPGTFARWRNPSLANNILDPLANIYAGVNYALHNYGVGMLTGGGNHSGGRYVGYATGTNYVPNDGPAYLHKGEAVIPAAINAKGAGRSAPAVHMENVTINDATDLELRVRQAMFAESSYGGVF